MMEMEKERRSRERPLRSSSAAMGATQQQQRERPTRTVVAPVAARESRQKEVVAVIAREVRQKEVQVLRKKNQELTDITRKLEEKVKSLEQWLFCNEPEKFGVYIVTMEIR
ncbi:unnamed protein product [Notodromas monacha]|uniref:Uncharacterized protein n=1 Tax=Notodromas monacha TaxID=399045 RepID=A0A7R9C053_9CRUS|nr:unnamed protein product [Notodromas monacha]CAG0923542.1 unnamed protein product [Notodromas monacha]